MIERFGLISSAALIPLLLAVAAAVHKFFPGVALAKSRIRRTFILTLLHVVTLALAISLAPFPAWSHRALVVATLFKAFAFTQLAVVMLFDFILRKLKMEVVSILSDLTVGAGYIFATVWTLGASNVDTTSVITGSAIVSGVLAISLQATLGNILGGVAIQLDGSVHVGDWIQLENGRQGRVKQIRWRHTVIETRDWSTMIVPNAQLLAQTITLLGHRNDALVPQRMWVYFNVDFRFAPSKICEVVSAALHGSPIENVASDPPANVICVDLAKDGRESFAVYAVRYWIIDLASDDATSTRVRARIFTALKRAKIPLARPALTQFVADDNRDDLDRKSQKHTEERLRLLRDVTLFEALTDDEKRTLASHMHFAPFAPGELMTRQGAVAHFLYVIASGRAEVRLRTDSGESRLVATIEAPTFFGEMGLMMGEPRSADVFAVSDVECLRLDKVGFEAVIMNRPELARAMSATLAERQVELEAATQGMNENARRERVSSEQQRMLERIQSFFGLGRSERPPRM